MDSWHHRRSVCFLLYSALSKAFVDPFTHLFRYQLAITIGLLIAAIVDHSTSNRNDSGSYRIPIAVQFLWGLIIFFGMLLLPETPRMHIKRGHPERAAKSLSR